jgi:hypothetical protein
MNKNVPVQIVESISDDLARMEENIRARAYEKFLRRDPESNRELDDWLAAEREVCASLQVSLTENSSQINAIIPFNEADLKDLIIRAAAQDILIETTSLRPLFKVIHLAKPIDPARLKARYSAGSLHLTAPVRGAAAVQISA